MRVRRLIALTSVVGLAVLGLVAPSPAGAAATETVALYQMNEAPGASVLVDSSGNGIDGAIGADVTTGVVFDGATAHRFPRRQPNTPPAYPEHPNRVPHDPRLNPGTADFAFTVRMRTTHSFGNVIQKGQSTVPGGYFKMENPGGVPTCLFRGVDGSRGVSAGRDLSDGQWHTIRCERTSTGVSMTVDGVRVATLTGPTGSISNDWPLSIAGKLQCDQIEITCDYFGGDIDWVRIETQGQPDTVAPSAPGTPVATSTQPGRVDLAWDAATDDRATQLRYSVFRDQSTTPVGTVLGGTTGTIRFSETGLTPGAVHTYRVRASDGTNNGPRSEFSNPVTVDGSVVNTTTTTTSTTTTSTTTTSTSTTSTTSTTTTAPTTTTTTIPPNRPPSGRLSAVTVSGTRITVTGTASDPDGVPIVQVADIVGTRRTDRHQWVTDGRFTMVFSTSKGDHEVCVNVLDNPTWAPTSLGCRDVVVK